MILTIRTDKPEAEIGLYDGLVQVAYDIWPAHRQLAETLNSRIENLLSQSGHELTDITGIVAYEGPGSFTGLRIGISVANAMAYSLAVPVAAAGGDNWQADGINHLPGLADSSPIAPQYGSPVHITQPRK